MSTIRAIFKFIIVLIISSSLYAKDDTCKKIYQDCFNNVPKNIITYYKNMDTYGVVNTNNINFRDIPLIASNNSLIIKKIKKNERIQIRKVFFLKSNTSVSLKLVNKNNFEIVNNYRFGKWYLISYMGKEGFIFSDYVTLDKVSKKYDRYRHIKSVDWTKNKVGLQENIELEIVSNNQDNLFEIKGYAWHFNKGFYKLNQTVNKEFIFQNSFIIDDFKIFFFDKDEIYLESDIEIFTGIYKRY